MQTLTHAFHQIRRIKEDAHDKGLDVRFYPVRSRAFTPDIVVQTEETDTELQVWLSLTSIYGFNGILPDYFSDEIIQDPKSGLKEFLDIFSHRQLDLLFDVWSKYQCFAETTMDATRKVNRQMDQVLLALGGTGMTEPEDDPLFIRGLKRCLVGLFQRRQKTPMGLKFLMTSYFGSLETHIEQHTVSYRPIPQAQRTRLGTSTSQLGFHGNFLAGARMEDTDGSFSITLKSLDLETFYRFLPGGESWLELSELLRVYTGNQWDCSGVLELRADEIPQWTLGSMRLGADTWTLSEEACESATVPIGAIGAIKS